MTQRTELGEAQKALQHQLNEVKALIGEFEEKRAAFGVGLVFFCPDRFNFYNDGLFFFCRNIGSSRDCC